LRSQVRFFMHPEDEREFVTLCAGCVTMNPHEPQITYLRGQHALVENDGSIQFWRSQLEGHVLTSGRLALATTGFGLEERLPRALVAESEQLFIMLRRHLRKTYLNGAVRWWNPSLPVGPTNPTKPDRAMWLGPVALRWWQGLEQRKLKDTLQGRVEVSPLEQRAPNNGLKLTKRDG
jgi:hypothetical protein